MYRHTIAIRYGEVDMQEVVFNAHYLAYCDDAIETWLRTEGISVRAYGWDFMLKKAVLEWQASATVGETLDIDVAVARWGNTSFDVGFIGAVGERPVFTCTVTYVGVEPGTTTTMPCPPELRARLGP
jgi:acyl-CoA thioester hydrolase